MSQNIYSSVFNSFDPSIISIYIFGTFALHTSGKRYNQEMSSTVCIPCIDSVPPRVCLVNVPFLAFF